MRLCRKRKRGKSAGEEGQYFSGPDAIIRNLRFLQCEPRLLDDISASRQTRSRIFWGNLLSLRGDLPVIKKEMIENSAAPLSSPAVSRLRTRVTRNNSGKQGESSGVTMWRKY